MKNAGVIGPEAPSVRITSRAEFVEKLGAATPRLLCALIHKFDVADLNRCLTETDHPFGDRRSREPRPGNVEAVERALATHHQLSQDDVRRAIWSNLSRLVRNVGCGRLLPTRVRTLLATLPPAQPKARQHGGKRAVVVDVLCAR